MVYQFELDEITNCGDCPCCDTVSGCQLGESEESFDKMPADCPLVANSKTETTSCEACSADYVYQEDWRYCPNCGRRLEETP